MDPTSGQFVDEQGCGFGVSSYRPATRLEVYKGKFNVSVPIDYNLFLGTIFGESWKMPINEGPHGKIVPCAAQSHLRRVWNVQGMGEKWISDWEELIYIYGTDVDPSLV